VALTPDQDAVLKKLFSSSAWQKYREDRKSEIAFADACRFWGFTDATTADALDKGLEQLRMDLTEIEFRVRARGIVLSDAKRVTEEDIDSLLCTHAFLEGRFARHLNLLRSRGGGKN
jgi:hypothetical protein